MSGEGHLRFDVAAGSVTGRSHALAGRGNQDAWAFAASGARLVAVVCDGCGSGAHSEVGATLGARLCVGALGRALDRGARLGEASLWGGLRAEVLDALRPIARAAGERTFDTVAELFLFTIVGVAVDGDDGAFFAAGDGAIARNGELTRLGPFPGDAPPYLGYGLSDRGEIPGWSLLRAFDARSTEHALIGTDGALALADHEDGRELRRLWEEPRHFRNRDALRRTLSLLNREESRPLWDERRIERRRGLMEDDATVIVLRAR